MESLRIALSIYTFKPNTGGLQTHAEQLCRALLARGHEVAVITRCWTRFPRGRDYLLFNELSESASVNDVPVKALRCSAAHTPVLWLVSKCMARPRLQTLGLHLYRSCYRRAARESFKGFDLVHHVGQASPLTGFAAASASRELNLPFVVQPTSHPHHNGDSQLDIRLYGLSKRLLVHTHYEAAYFRERGVTSDIDVVGNGIIDRCDGNGERFRAKLQIEGPMILFIGRKDADKGYPLTLEAFKMARRKAPNLTLVCMGPSGGCTHAPAAEGVFDLDYASEDAKHDALAACTCLCVPSQWESFGLVYMEAGRYSKPSIARNLPVLRELLQGGRAALLVGAPDDSRNRVMLGAGELASAMLDLARSPGKCQSLGAACQRLSEQFLWPNIVRRFEASYSAAAAKPRCDRIPDLSQVSTGRLAIR